MTIVGGVNPRRRESGSWPMADDSALSVIKDDVEAAAAAAAAAAATHECGG